MLKNTFKKHFDVLLIKEEGKRHFYVLIKDYIYVWSYTTSWKKISKILKSPVNDCFKINGKQMIKMAKKVNMLDSNIIKGK